MLASFAGAIARLRNGNGLGRSRWVSVDHVPCVTWTWRASEEDGSPRRGSMNCRRVRPWTNGLSTRLSAEQHHSPRRFDPRFMRINRATAFSDSLLLKRRALQSVHAVGEGSSALVGVSDARAIGSLGFGLRLEACSPLLCLKRPGGSLGSAVLTGPVATTLCA